MLSTAEEARLEGDFPAVKARVEKSTGVFPDEKNMADLV